MKVLFIFSEGPHDAAFIKQVLELNLGINHTKCKIKEFPAPLNAIFKQTMQEHDMGDMSLDMATKFFLPDYVFRTDSSFILLFNTGGKDNVKVVKQLLSQILLRMQKQDKSFDFSLSDIRCLFIYDADYQQSSVRIQEMQEKLFPITENDAYPDDAEMQSEPPTVLLNQDTPAFYTWPDNSGTGTLEDILLPMYETAHADLLSNAEAFVNENFTRNFKCDKGTPAEICAKREKSQKAQITIAGQGKSPSYSMTVIVKENVLSDKTTFKGNPLVQKFAEALKTILVS